MPFRTLGQAVVNTARALRNNRVNIGKAATIAGGTALVVAAGTALFSKLGSTASTADPYRRISVNFPEDLLENDHWIEFTAFETKGAATDTISSFLPNNAGLRGSEILGGTIRLPMPSSLSTDYNPMYDDPSLGSAAGMALKPFDRAMYENADLGSLVSQGGAGMAATTFMNAGAGGAVGAVTGAAAGVVGENVVGAGLKVFGGIAVNPHKVVLFTGVGFRNHTFTWKLSPRNREESNSIRLICEMFKFYSHPEYLAAGLFFKYPEFFRIKFRHPTYLFELEPSVCEDIRIDYHGQGFPAYIRDADGSGIPAPAEVSISLTFKETEIITKNTLTRGLRNTPSPAGVIPEGRNRN